MFHKNQECDSTTLSLNVLFQRPATVMWEVHHPEGTSYVKIVNPPNSPTTLSDPVNSGQTVLTTHIHQPPQSTNQEDPLDLSTNKSTRKISIRDSSSQTLPLYLITKCITTTDKSTQTSPTYSTEPQTCSSTQPDVHVQTIRISQTSTSEIHTELYPSLRLRPLGNSTSPQEPISASIDVTHVPDFYDCLSDISSPPSQTPISRMVNSPDSYFVANDANPSNLPTPNRRSSIEEVIDSVASDCSIKGIVRPTHLRPTQKHRHKRPDRSYGRRSRHSQPY